MSPEAPFHIAGIILAAGLGSRFDPSGRRFKLMHALPDDGRSVLQASCEAMLKYVDSLVVVVGERQHELDSVFDQLPPTVQHVLCVNARAGMGASLKSGVMACSQADAWLVGLGDMPYISGQTIAAVCDRLRGGASMVRPFYRCHPGHPVGLDASWRASLLSLPDSAGAATLMRAHPDALDRLDVPDAGCIVDIDVPADIRFTTSASNGAN